MVRKFLAMSVIFGWASLPLYAQQKTATVIVHVQVEGVATPIAGAHVDVTFVDQHLVGETNAKGDFKIVIDPNAWGDLTISAEQYETYAHKQTNFGSGKSAYIVNLESTSGMIGTPVTSFVHRAAKANWEYGVLLQGGPGLEERTDFSFIMAGAHLGRVLTDNLGTGLLQGNFEYAVEVLPLWQSYTPKFQRLNCPTGATLASQCRQTTTGGTYRGASITPIMLRWNLTHGQRFMPWVQAAGGVLYTTRKYPGVGDLNPLDPTQTGPAADTSVWNFTPQGGIGAHYFIKPQRSIDMSVNAVHISSASLGDKNPGVNVALQMSIGYTWWK